jgi:hypothetical protein
MPAEGCTMNKHSDRPARQEADMLESLFEERRRMAVQPKDRTHGMKKHQRSDSKSDAAKTPEKPSK